MYCCVLNCRISALDYGEEAACWMSEFLQKNCRLIEHYKQDGRTCKLQGTGLNFFICSQSRMYIIISLSFSPCRNSLFILNSELFKVYYRRNETLTFLSFFPLCISTTGEKGSSSLSSANESQFLLISRSSTNELLMNVKPALESQVSLCCLSHCFSEWTFSSSKRTRTIC